MAEVDDLKNDQDEPIVDELDIKVVADGEVDPNGDGVLEPWQQTDDDNDVPVGTHIKMKSKLKGRIHERDDEISSLRSEIETLKQTRQTKLEPIGIPQRPLSEDFDTDEEYHAELTKWEDGRIQARIQASDANRVQTAAATQAKEALDTSVNSHYTRAESLIKDSNITDDDFKSADMTVRKAMELIRPKEGDLIAEQLISFLGEGSEKVLYFLGRNKNALTTLKGLLQDDPGGMKAAVYLGQQKERLTTPKKQTSKAPPPANDATGDSNVNAKGAAFKRKYDEAHKGNSPQAAYNAKKEAKAAGVDVSGW